MSLRPRRIGYAKLGRSMPLSLEKCGSLGGDVEMVPTLKLLAERHPDVEFTLIGRNSGENPADVGLPPNVNNPWRLWGPLTRQLLKEAGLTYANLSVMDHQRVHNILSGVTGNAVADQDAIIMWLGQHGTTNTPLPTIKDRSQLTKPYDWATLYASYLLQGINTWRDVDPLNREEVLLNADTRNYVKYRDSRWPWRHSVLAQYEETHHTKHERYGHGKSLFEQFRDAPEVSHASRSSQSLSTFIGYEHNGDLWHARSHSTYSRLEISSLIPGTPFGDTIQFNDDFDRPHDFGVVVNETRREVNPARARVNIIKDWVLPLDPGFIHGKWSDKSLRKLGVNIEPVAQLEYIAKLQTTRCTLTTPASGSGWATAKPWEAFAAGVVCFFHPAYDDQDNILGDAPHALYRWLRLTKPLDLLERVKYMRANPNYWREVVQLQRDHFEAAVTEKRYLRMIEERLNL